MVSKKSINYGRFNGFQLPSMVPKAPRSLRRNSRKESSENSKLCAFELLADVADKLLQESESSTSITGQEQKEQIIFPIVKWEEPEVKVKHVKRKFEPSLKESLESDNDSVLEHVSDVKTSDFVKKIENNVKLETSERKNVDKLDREALSQGELTFTDQVESCVNNTRVLDKSFSSVHKGNVKMGITDDDENSFRRTKMRAFRSRSCGRYRRIRKMLTSRYRNLTQKKDYELTNPTKAASKRRKIVHHNSSNTAFNSVKFSIKSFKVPELYIEIPETATVASLKTTVMEAVKAILGRDLHVGILLEGKKVRDNNRTLQQTGISRNCDLETLGFTLEPSFLEASPSPIQKEPPLSLPDTTSQHPLSSTGSPITDVGLSNSCLDHPPATGLDKNQEILPLQTEALTEEKALVPVAVNDQKLTKKCDFSHRRIRRPFSVSEVEALVEAVETIGTGRWREIKLRAFDEANHRTYVDLKDKWKTLVHTASISPQQRRGEPVPQHLLDRVLAAHAYCSQNQSKQQRTHQIEPLQILDGSCVGI